MKVISREDIVAALDDSHAIQLIEAGFAALSAGHVTMPPVGHLDLKNPPGECHIKYGHILGDDYFAIKLATGFYENAARGLPSGSGMTIVFSAETGFPEVLLDDAGYLTDVRTAMAGCISAKYLAPGNVTAIGIVGAGLQARLQLEYLKYVTDCRDAIVWARRSEQAAAFQEKMRGKGFNVSITASLEDLCGSSNLIVTNTPATEPLLFADWIAPGTLITAVGSDGAGKQELDADIYKKVDLAVVDSVPQCLLLGESHYAVDAGITDKSALVELGTIVSGDAPGRQNDDQIIVADLTGVAVQDIQIAKSVLLSLG
ncbi:MAG: ornithine cyclodeaminase family protein [Woeseiaceae bacterium]